MQFWESGVVLTGLLLAVLLVAAEGLRKVAPPLARLGIPGCIVAGVLGLALGPDVLGLIPLNRQMLETVVYHGLAIVFIAVGLQAPQRGPVGPGVRSMSLAIPTMEVVQLLVGVVLVLLMGLFTASALHPGIGLLLPLGFEQGPGQALSLGAAWEAGGLEDGAQVGLIVAAVGYGWSVVAGVALVAWGRHKGWVDPPRSSGGPDSGHGDRVAVLPAGALEALTRQVVAISMVYLLTYGICLALASALAPWPDVAAMVWGFHFILGALVAIPVRWGLARLPGGTPLHDALLGRVSGLTVDVMTCAALAAVQVAVLRANWGPIVLVTTAGGLVTLLLCTWLASRAFPDAPFEHAVVWFGMSTGTLPMGLALLRAVDPEMRSPAPMSAVLGSAVSIPFAAPILVGLIPVTAALFPERWPGGGWAIVGVGVLYLGLLLVLWRALGPLRLTGPLKRFWVAGADGEPPA